MRQQLIWEGNRRSTFFRLTVSRSATVEHPAVEIYPAMPDGSLESGAANRARPCAGVKRHQYETCDMLTGQAISLSKPPTAPMLVAIRAGVHVALGEAETIFRAREDNKRMKDQAAHACHTLCRARVVEEMRLHRATKTAEHLKLVLSIIDRPSFFSLRDE